MGMMTPKAAALRDYMSSLSEEAYSAGWMSGLEFALWKAVLEGPGRYGRLNIQEGHISRLKKLADACGGWIRFDDANDEVWVAIREWAPLYESEKDQHQLD